MNDEQELSNKIRLNLALWSPMRVEAAAVERKLMKANLGQDEYPTEDELNKIVEANRFLEEEIIELMLQAHPK